MVAVGRRFRARDRPRADFVAIVADVLGDSPRGLLDRRLRT
jgi:hypothetical protein